MSPKFGCPTKMIEGQWAGKVLRFSLKVAHQPDVGRKSGDKDRRPISNFPITRIKVLEVDADGSETVLLDDRIKITDLLCQVSLTAGVPPHKPVPSVLPTSSTNDFDPSLQHQSSSIHPPYPPSSQQHASISQQNPVQAANFASSFFASSDSLPASSQASTSASLSTRPTAFASTKNATCFSSGSNTATSAAASSVVPSSDPFTAAARSADAASSSSLVPPPPQAREHIKTIVSGTSSGSGSNSHGKSGSDCTGASESGSGGPVAESYTGEEAVVGSKKRGGRSKAKVKKVKTKPGRNVFGNLFKPATRLADLDGSPGIWFVFQNIAIRTEGQYSLHFKVFDLESRSVESHDAAPILADCFSKPFTVYSPRYHPGVPPSTDLDKHFVGQGFRLTLKKGAATLPELLLLQLPPREEMRKRAKVNAGAQGKNVRKEGRVKQRPRQEYISPSNPKLGWTSTSVELTASPSSPPAADERAPRGSRSELATPSAGSAPQWPVELE